jgi:hypothetical protein
MPTATRRPRVHWWLLAAWLLLMVPASELIGTAVEGSRDSFQLTVAIACWLVWGATFGAMLIPRPVTLTAIRIIVPASVLATGWAAVAAGSDADRWTLVAPLLAIVATLLVLAPKVGELFVDGASYGPERRMPLRPPGVLLLGPIELGWIAAVVGACAGPLLLADQRWMAGLIALLVGWPVAAVAARSLHVLAERCIVFVPNGFVIIDRITLADAFLIQRRLLALVGPAPADTTAYDLTAGALGLALQVDLTEPDMIVVNPPRRSPRDHTPPTTPEVSSVLFAPSRPGAFLKEADRRRLPLA